MVVTYGIGEEKRDHGGWIPLQYPTMPGGIWVGHRQWVGQSSPQPHTLPCMDSYIKNPSTG
ncbi:putative forkhead protein/ forkhead protein domain protein [Meiothermus ruber H328]|nr:putative forkhead protein/ forkhead protein domain protein [Meiothermus ruber H328]